MDEYTEQCKSMKFEVDPLETEESNNKRINMLNKHCLQTIFRKLSPVEKVRIELVCKIWQEESQNAWSRIKDIELDSLKLGFLPVGKLHEIKPITYHVAREVLKRCGKYIHRIDFKEKQKFCAMDVISEFCPNIQCIENAYATSKGLRCMANDRTCRNLVKLHIRALVPERTEWDVLFGTIFDNNKNLQFLKIGNGNALNGDCLDHLPLDKLKELSIQIPYSNAARFIERLVWVSMAATNLTSLCICVKNGNEDIINSLSNVHFKKMTELELTCLLYIDNLDEKLSRIFMGNKSLIRLKLYLAGMDVISGECFLNLSSSIQIFQADTYRCTIDEYLCTSLQKFENLTILDIDITREDYVYILIDSLTNCLYLRKLSLNLVVYTTCALAEAIRGLDQLEHLKITSIQNNDAMDEHLFQCISSITGLKSLSISGFQDLSENGFGHLLTEIDLTELYISDIPFFSGDNLGKAKRLENLTVIDCPDFSEDAIVEFLKVGFNLKFLTLRGIEWSNRERIIIGAVSLVNSVKYTQEFLVIDMDLENIDIRLLQPGCKKLQLVDTDPQSWTSP